jgi:hypothetical protein
MKAYSTVFFDSHGVYQVDKFKAPLCDNHAAKYRNQLRKDA